MNKNDILSVPDVVQNTIDLSNRFTRSLTAGVDKSLNGLWGVKTSEGKCDKYNSDIMNYPSTVNNITLVLRMINSVNYFTESEKRDLHFFITAWNNGNRDYSNFNILIEKYQEALKIPSKEEARKKIKTTLDVLLRCSLIIQNDKSKSNYSGINIPVFQSLSYKKNVISLEFSKIFFELIKKTTSFIIINRIIYQIPINKSPAFHLALRLMNNTRMNVNKQNENIIPVHSLIESCPTFPSEEKAGNDLTNRIRKPFEKYMDYLCEIEILQEWTYCYSDGTPLSDKELNTTRFFYEKFKSYHVKFIMKDWDQPREVYLKYLKNKKESKKRGRKKKLKT